MLLMLVSLLCCVPAAKACLQCDRSVRLLHEDFILSAPTVQDQIDMKKICDHAYVTYRQTSRERKGVIDPTTLYRARTEYQSEFDRFLKTKHTGSVTFEAIQIMEKGRKILEKHLDTFIRDGLCPNKCEYPVQAEEGGQAVLNCFLPWHRLLLGRPEYHYSWAPGVPGTKKLTESDFKALVVTDDSSVVLNQLHVDEQGTYRCSLQEGNRTVFYRVTFLLAVAPLPDQTHRPVITLPPLPHGDNYSPFLPTEGLLVPVIAMVTALSLAASVGLTVVLGLMINQKRAAEEPRRKRKEGKHTQNTGNEYPVSRGGKTSTISYSIRTTGV
ncbi:izumo sperm-egg fusion protein 1 isoform X5 [Siniperca chuatsi]|uniref:izumo sperm-egg fusion protein 1 isoform X5 n=1 Tax=Siniperca chuatsi TaxID=119488 RepID=UPI001CE0550F|nr:izumo sperm-egg fusion protein 1 isoform X5 [Siniperca chuatsi]